MAAKKEETASFVLRFTQKIFETEEGTPQAQWRGNIRHVQGGEEKRFSEFDDVVNFIQTKLADLTLTAMEDKSPEEQKGILSTSFDLWKKMAFDTPKLVLETIKDPKKGITNIQTQITSINETIGHKIEEKMAQIPDMNAFKPRGKDEQDVILSKLEEISKEMAALNKKIDALGKK